VNKQGNACFASLAAGSGAASGEHGGWRAPRQNWRGGGARAYLS
jgi:hypothetical protein